MDINAADLFDLIDPVLDRVVMNMKYICCFSHIAKIFEIYGYRPEIFGRVILIVLCDPENFRPNIEFRGIRFRYLKQQKICHMLTEFDHFVL